MASIHKEIPELSDSSSLGAWVEVGVARKLWHLAYDMSQDDSLGLKVGSNLSIRSFSVLAPLLSHSPTVAQALQNAIRFQNLLSQSGRFVRVPDTSALVLKYSPAASYMPLHFCQLDSVMAGLVKALRMFIDERISPTKILLFGPERNNFRLYQDYFGCEIMQGAERSEIHLSLDVLNQTITGADGSIYQLSKALAEERLARHTDAEQLYASVADAIVNGRFSRASLNQVANELAVSDRTLQRHLGEQGLSFRRIQDEIILKTATRLLGDTQSSIQEISSLLGYSEVSAFSRAIKRVAGMSPQSLRDTLA